MEFAVRSLVAHEESGHALVARMSRARSAPGSAEALAHPPADGAFRTAIPIGARSTG